MKLSKNEWIAVGAGLIVVGLFFTGAIFLLFKPAMTTNQDTMSNDNSIQGQLNQNSADQQAAAQAGDISNSLQDIPNPEPGQLLLADNQVGTGDEAKAGDTVSVHYIGVLKDGTKFDSSLDRGQPFTFTLGIGQVIKGWDQGVVGMKVGGTRTLVIPPDLGYGSQAIPSIPANSVLIFQVELLDVKTN